MANYIVYQIKGNRLHRTLTRKFKTRNDCRMFLAENNFRGVFLFAKESDWSKIDGAVLG